MIRVDRRRFLGAVGTAAALVGTTGAVAAAQSETSGGGGSGNGSGSESENGGGSALATVVDFDPANLPESVTFGADGNLYFSLPASGPGVAGVRALPAARTDESGLDIGATDPVATLPASPVGITLSPGGDALYAAAARGEEDTTGAYRICPTDRPTVQLGSFGPFPNDPVVDPSFDRLLVTESFAGAVYAVSLDGSGAAVWLDDPLLAAPGEDGFGANGIAMRDGDVYVANTARGAVVRVPVGPDGAAGAPEVYAEDERLVGADGIEFRGSTLYVAVNGQNAIRRIASPDSIETVVEGGVLDFPSDVAFGGAGGSDLFVANFASSSPTTGPGPRVLRADDGS